MIAVGTRSGRVAVYEASSPELVSEVSGHSAGVVSLSWCRGRLASASLDQTVKLWHLGVDGLTVTRVFSGWSSAVEMVEWYPSCDRVLIKHHGAEKISVINLNGRREFTIDRGGSVDLSPDGTMIATAWGRDVEVWDGVFGSLTVMLDTDRFTEICAWNPARRGVLALGGSTGIEIWDVLADSTEPIQVLSQGAQVLSMTWSPQGDMLALGLPSGIEIWDVSRPTLLGSVPAGGADSCLAWSPDGSMLASLTWLHRTGLSDDIPPHSCPWEMRHVARLTIWHTSKETTSCTNPVRLDYTPLSREATYPPHALAWAPNSTMIAVGTGSQKWLLSGETKDECGMRQPTVPIYRTHPGKGLTLITNRTGPVRPVPRFHGAPTAPG